MSGTRHTCGGPVFGRLAAQGRCPRCDELRAGYEPRKGWGGRGGYDERRLGRDVDSHFASEKHRSGGCGPVCTFGEW